MIYSPDILIPRLCPLQFAGVEATNEMKHYPDAFRYVQKWHTTEAMHVQIRHSTTGKTLTLGMYDWATGLLICHVHSSQTTLNGYFYYDFHITPVWDTPPSPPTLPVPYEGLVYFKILEGSTVLCDTIIGYIDDAGLIPLGEVEITTTFDTFLLEVWNSHTDFDVDFYVTTGYTANTVFQIRVEGGFIPNGYAPKNDMGVFSDQHQQDSMAFSMPYSQRVLTLGDSLGIPIHMIDRLNAYFACDVNIIGNIQYQCYEEMSVKEIGYMKALGTIGMKTRTNRFTQNAGGTVYLVDRNGVYLLDGNGDKILI